MTNATATLWGKYKFPFTMPKNPTMHELAWEIAMAVHKAEKRTKFTNAPRTYNYIVEALKESANTLNFMRYNGEPDKREEIYQTANDLQNESKWHKAVCEECGGTGYTETGHPANPEKADCYKCNGHGHVWKRLSWRVGQTFDFAIAIDIDSHDEANLQAVRDYYQVVLEMRFKTFKTGGGYWLIGDKLIMSKPAFRYRHCLILNPGLKPLEMEDYVKGLLSLDKGEGKDFDPATPEKIKASEYYKAPTNLNFDIAFTFLSIKREQSTLRESAKFKGDRIVEIVTNAR